MGLRDSRLAKGVRQVLNPHYIGGRQEDEPDEGTARVAKQEAQRRSSLPGEVKRTVAKGGGTPKPYDPKLLKDLAQNPIAQAYSDTLSQDVAQAHWNIIPRDDRREPTDSEITDARREIEQIHPQYTFRDWREMIVENLLEQGDSCFINHFADDARTEWMEAHPVDTSRMFKVVDDHGFVEEYIQASFNAIEISARFEPEEIGWVSWDPRRDHVYGFGPAEKARPVINLLDELNDKETKDLEQGAPPGIVSASDDADEPLPAGEFNRVDEQWDLKEGQRHRHILSRGSWDYIPISPGYDTLQLLERSKYWVHVLGAIYKVNSPYAGFDFQEGNMAQNQAQTAAYQQRGFRVTLQYIEQLINKNIIWPHLSEDLRFEFVEEQTIEEQKNRAELREAQARAGQALADAGLKVSYQEGKLVVEDGEIEEGSSDPAPASPFAQLQQSVDGLEEQIEDVDVEKTGGPGEHLTEEQAMRLDALLLSAHMEQVQPASIEKIKKRSWEGDESVPEFVVEKIREAIREGAVFSDMDLGDLAHEVKQEVEGVLEEHLTNSRGWSLRSVTEDLQEKFPGVEGDQLETVARTETTSVLNTARENGYTDRPDAAQYLYKWVGSTDGRITDLCEELLEETNPKHGGSPVTMTELKRLERQLQKKHFPALSRFRAHCPHPNCRKTFVRVTRPAGEYEEPADREVPA